MSHSRASLRKAVLRESSVIAHAPSRTATATSHGRRLMPGPAGGRSALEARQPLESVHVRAKGRRNRDGAVGFLVVLEHGHHGATDRQTRAVQGGAELGAPAALGAVADLGPAPAERVVVRARRDLAV